MATVLYNVSVIYRNTYNTIKRPKAIERRGELVQISRVSLGPSPKHIAKFKF